MMPSFAIDISKFMDKFGIQANTAARKVMLDIQKEVMQATPVDTGALRSNWFLGLGAPPTDMDKALIDGGARAQAMAAANLLAFKWGDTAFLTNNLPYGPRIEFAGWSHTKAPAGMLRVTVARFQAQFGRWS